MKPRAAALILLAAAGAGCPAGGLRTGRALPRAAVERIVPSSTTKAQLFAILGAPTAIVGPGETVLAPSPTVRVRVLGDAPDLFDHGGSYPIQGDALLELFAGRSGDLRVYHYVAARERGWFFVFPVFFGVETYRTLVDELYVLVDEGTERVEGVVHRPAR